MTSRCVSRFEFFLLNAHQENIKKKKKKTSRRVSRFEFFEDSTSVSFICSYIFMTYLSKCGAFLSFIVSIANGQQWALLSLSRKYKRHSEYEIETDLSKTMWVLLLLLVNNMLFCVLFSLSASSGYV